MRTRSLSLVLLIFTALFSQVGYGQDAEDMRGSWFTQADEALSAAEAAEKPVLAVAMDHG